MNIASTNLFESCCYARHLYCIISHQEYGWALNTEQVMSQILRGFLRGLEIKCLISNQHFATVVNMAPPGHNLVF